MCWIYSECKGKNSHWFILIGTYVMNTKHFDYIETVFYIAIYIIMLWPIANELKAESIQCIKCWNNFTHLFMFDDFFVKKIPATRQYKEEIPWKLILFIIWNDGSANNSKSISNYWESIRFHCVWACMSVSRTHS